MLTLKKSHLRYTLLATVSACALIVSIESQPVRAEDAQNWWLSVEGQYQFLGNKTLVDPLGPDLPLGEGLGIAGELGWKLDDIHTIVARGRIGRESDDWTSGADFSSRKDVSFIGDLELGRDVGLGSIVEGELTAFVGVRVGHVRSGTSSYSSFNSATQSDNRSFTGAGPRAGIRLSKSLSDNMSLDLAAAGGVMFGRQKEDVSFYSGFGPDSSSSESRSAVVPTVDASAALKFLLSEDTSLSAGYRVDAMFDALRNENGQDVDRIIHGPFLKLTIKN